MRRGFRLGLLCLLLCICGLGCARNPLVLQGQLDQVEKNYQQLAKEKQELQLSHQKLDQGHQELLASLARSEQQAQITQQEAAALREQLKHAATQLAKLQTDQSQWQAKLGGPGESGRPRARITANSSLRDNLPKLDLPGVEVRQDGDVVRIELPTDQLFENGEAQLRPGAGRLLQDVAAAVVRRYPEQMIGLEGHTDSAPLPAGSRWISNLHLSIGRAMAVYDALVAQHLLPTRQLVVTGHGGNSPVASNGTAAGQQRNRRVELVIYPETVTP